MAADPLQDVYKQLIEIQKSFLESQQSVHDELNELKEFIVDRIHPLEEKVMHHETIFAHIGRVVTWLVPSGTAIGLIGWLSGVFGTHH